MTFPYHEDIRASRVSTGTCFATSACCGELLSACVFRRRNGFIFISWPPHLRPRKPLNSDRIGGEWTKNLFIFAVKDGDLRMAPDAGHRVSRSLPHGSTKHECFFAGQPVDAAGEIQFEDGKIVDINFDTGSYCCGRLTGAPLQTSHQELRGHAVRKVEEALENAGIPSTEVAQALKALKRGR